MGRGGARVAAGVAQGDPGGARGRPEALGLLLPVRLRPAELLLTELRGLAEVLPAELLGLAVGLLGGRLGRVLLGRVGLGGALGAYGWGAYGWGAGGWGAGRLGGAGGGVGTHRTQLPAVSSQQTPRQTHSAHRRHWTNSPATSCEASTRRLSLVVPRVPLRSHCASSPTSSTLEPISPPSRLPPSAAIRPPKPVTECRNVER